MSLVLKEQKHSAFILTDERDDSPLQYATEVTYSDPFKTPAGTKVQGQYVKSGTPFICSMNKMDLLIQTARVSGFKTDETITDEVVE